MTFATRAALVLVVAGAAAAVSAQQPSPARSANQQEIPDVTFRVEVNYVEIDAFVTDAQGNPVANLSAEDFEVVEEGTRQTIASFARVDIPIERGERPLFAARPVEPDVRTNAGTEGRIYLILLDDLHVHPTRAPKVRASLRQFIEKDFGTNDLAAVVSARGHSGDSQDFTNNPRLLLRAIDKFTGNIPFETPEVALVLGDGQAAPADPTRLEQAHRARVLMQSVRNLSEFLAGVRGRRKTIIFVSEGIGYDIYDMLDRAGAAASGVLEDSEKAVAAATRANVTIYTIDPRGPLDSERLADATPADTSNFRRSQDSLRVLAAETGGFAAVNQNDLSNAFERIVRENSAYYILGYYPTNERRDGKYRQVDVRVKRPGLQVRSRRGYLSPRGNAPREQRSPSKAAANGAAATALASPLPVKGVPLKVFAAPYKGAPQKAVVALSIEFDPSALAFTERDGTFTEEIDVVHSATDPRGKAYPAVRHGLKLSFKRDRFEQVKAQGIRVLSQMELPPGRYQIRTAVGNKEGAAGSVLYDLDVPDFDSARLEMSGVSLTSVAASQFATARPTGKSRDALPGAATATREFDAADTLALYGEVYENAPGVPAHTLDITTELRGDDGRVMATMAEQRESSELQGKSGGYGFSSEIALKGLAPGLYVIHVHARSNVGSRPTVERDVQIHVR